MMLNLRFSPFMATDSSPDHTLTLSGNEAVPLFSAREPQPAGELQPAPLHDRNDTLHDNPHTLIFPLTPQATFE